MIAWARWHLARWVARRRRKILWRMQARARARRRRELSRTVEKAHPLAQRWMAEIDLVHAEGRRAAEQLNLPATDAQLQKARRILRHVLRIRAVQARAQAMLQRRDAGLA